MSGAAGRRGVSEVVRRSQEKTRMGEGGGSQQTKAALASGLHSTACRRGPQPAKGWATMAFGRPGNAGASGKPDVREGVGEEDRKKGRLSRRAPSRPPRWAELLGG